jgi:23S rRNA (adenine2030-N6)-methyltransferase
MFSYRHAFHAGNHADVLKHITLLATMRHLMQKEPSITFIDTHAGAGLYRLDGDYAQKSGESNDGLLKLVTALKDAPDLPELVQDYLQQIAHFNPDQGHRIYPGSPAIMARQLRYESRDRLKLFEMHPTDIGALAGHMTQFDLGRAVQVTRGDGFTALKTLLPPPASSTGSKRAMVLIDPSYEIKSDYTKVQDALADALERFPTGCYLVWHPIIPRPEAHDLPRKLKTLVGQTGRPWLHATLSIGRSEQGGGLTASGMFVVNPPFTLANQLRPALTTVGKALARGTGQEWQVQTSG